MSRIKGTVSKASKGKFGYFLMLDGNDFYYNTKFKPKCGEGDVVGIEFEQKGESRGQITKLVVLDNNSGGYDASNSEKSFGGSSAPRSGGSGSAGNGDRQHQITWQSCQKVAATVVQALVASGAVAEKGNATSKRAEIEGAFDELTVRLYKDALDPQNSQTLKTVNGIDADAGGGTDGSGDWGGDGDGDNDWS